MQALFPFCTYKSRCVASVQMYDDHVALGKKCMWINDVLQTIKKTDKISKKINLEMCLCVTSWFSHMTMSSVQTLEDCCRATPNVFEMYFVTDGVAVTRSDQRENPPCQRSGLDTHGRSEGREATPQSFFFKLLSLQSFKPPRGHRNLVILLGPYKRPFQFFRK